MSASFGFGLLGGAVGVAAGNLSGNLASRLFTTNIVNPSYKPSVGVLLSGPSMVAVPNSAASSLANMFGSTVVQGGVAGVAPPVSNTFAP